MHRGRLAPLALALAAALGLGSCGGDGAGTAQSSDAAAAETTAGCLPQQTRPDGTCCPPGHFFEYAQDSCARVGPPECAQSVLTDPTSCVPRWCPRWRDAAGEACAPAAEGCALQGEVCTAQELADGAGCEAGRFPGPDAAGGCLAAGWFPGSGLGPEGDGAPVPLPALPPLSESVPPGVPALVPLPALDDTFFCIDPTTGIRRFCSAEETGICRRAADGSLPDPDRCVLVGVPWASRVCPPGFAIDTGASGAKGGLPACRADPADCGLDLYGDATLTDDKALFVNAATGDDDAAGTRAAPLKTIAVALAQAATGATVAVAAGVYTEALTLSRPVRLAGRCAHLVKLAGPAGVPAVQVKGQTAPGEVSVRGLHVQGAGSGVYVLSGGQVLLQRLWIDKARAAGMLAWGGGVSVQAQSVLISGARAATPKGKFGHGVNVEGGAKVRLTDVRVSGCQTAGVSALGAGVSLDAVRLLVDGTLPRASDGLRGRGLMVTLGARLTLQGGWIVGNRMMGLFLDLEGAFARVSETRIEGNLSEKFTGMGGMAAMVTAGCRLELSDARLSGNQQAGVQLIGADATALAERLLVDGTLPRDLDAHRGWGIDVSNGARFSGSDLRVSGNTQQGLGAQGTGARIEATRLLVDGTWPEHTSGLFGRGLGATEGATLKLRQVRLTANRDVGLQIDGPKTVVSAEQLLIDHTLGRAHDDAFGFGLALQNGASLTVTEARLSNNHSVGALLTGDGVTAQASALLVDHTRPAANDGSAGRGIVVQSGAALTLQDSRVSANRDHGLLVDGPSTRLQAHRLVVDATGKQHSDGDFGHGVAVQSGANVTLVDGRLTANAGNGLTVSHPGSAVTATRLLVDQGLTGDGLGVRVQKGGHLRLADAWLRDNREEGLLVLSPQSVADVRNLLVERTTGQGTSPIGGRGVGVESGASLTLVGASLRDNREAAIRTHKAASVRLVGVEARATLAQGEGYFGTGIHFLDDTAPGSVVSCRVADNQSAGLLVVGSSAEVANCAFVRTGAAKLPGARSTGGDRAAPTVADGVILRLAHDVAVRDSVIADNPRAGVTLSDTQAAILRATVVSGGHFGVVTVDGQPAWLEGVLLHANQVNQSGGGVLALPPAPGLAQETAAGATSDAAQ